MAATQNKDSNCLALMLSLSPAERPLLYPERRTGRNLVRIPKSRYHRRRRSVGTDLLGGDRDGPTDSFSSIHALRLSGGSRCRYVLSLRAGRGPASAEQCRRRARPLLGTYYRLP